MVEENQKEKMISPDSIKKDFEKLNEHIGGQQEDFTKLFYYDLAVEYCEEILEHYKSGRDYFEKLVREKVDRELDLNILRLTKKYE